MRSTIPVLILFCGFVTFAGCLTEQTRAELSAKTEAVAVLTLKVDDLLAKVAAAETTHVADLASLKTQLADATAQLTAAREALAATTKKANKERADTAELVESTANQLSPVLAGFFPGAGIILGALGAAAGKVKRDLRKAA